MVVITYKMKDAMYYYTVKLILERGTIECGVFADAVDTDEKIPGKDTPLTIVESDDIREIVVLKILYIDVKNVVVGAENDGDVAYLPDFTFGHQLKPFVVLGLVLEQKSAVFFVISNHKNQILYKSTTIKLKNWN